MKSEKGITLMSLILYVILLVLVVSMLSIMSDLFFSNTEILTNNSKYIAELNKFNMYFIEDVKNNNDIYKIENNKIIFEDGTIYTYNASPDNGIYRNKVKICDNIEFCKFSAKQQKTNNTNKKIINVQMIIESPKVFYTNNDYTLKYW